MEQAANFFPWDEISEENVFPTGVYHFSVDELEDGMSNTGKRMFRARYTAKAPAEQAGMSHFEYYVTGTEENPNGINPGTMGARGLKKMLAKAQVPPSNDPAALCVSARGAELLITLNFYVEKDGQYAGTPRNRIADYHRLGERNVGVTQPLPGQGVGTSAPTMPPGPSTAPPPGPPAATPPPVSATPPGPPAAPTPGLPPAPAAAPTAAPPATAAPVPPAPAQPPVAGAPAAGVAPEPTMKCQVPGCGQDVPVSQFGAHMQTHMPAA